MNSKRVVPDYFVFARFNGQLNGLLQRLVALFPTAEKTEDHVAIKEEATQLLRQYFGKIIDVTERAAACRMLYLESWIMESEECRQAVFSSMGQTVFECWARENITRELEDFMKKHGLTKLTVEARGPRGDVELGGVINSPTQCRIAYVHPRTSRGYMQTRRGAITVVPLDPKREATLLRTQGDGTKVYELDLRSLID